MKIPVRRLLLFATYGIFLALCSVFLQSIRYTYLIRANAVEIYTGILALLFTILGIWMGFKLNGKRLRSETAVRQHFIPVQAQISSLSLSARELEVLSLMAGGLSNREIAEKLFLSANTVKTHISSLFSKLDVKRRTQAVARAKELGIIS